MTEPPAAINSQSFLHNLCLIPQTQNPLVYPRRTKWLVTLLVAFAAAIPPIGSATIMPAMPLISHTFSTSDTVTNLTVALYMLSAAFFPLYWAFASDHFGRRPVYIASFAMFTLFMIFAALARNITTLIVMRILAGAGGASVQAVGAGTMSDIWEVKERGRSMGVYYLWPLLGPLLGSVVGGVLADELGWRSTQWAMVVLGGLSLVGLVLGLPETLIIRKAEMMAMTEKNDTMSMRTALHWVKWCLVDPMRALGLLQYPAVAVTVVYASITFGTIYFINIAIETAFSHDHYNFKPLVVGFMYIPGCLGETCASILGGPWIDHIMKREARNKGRCNLEGKLLLVPEDRMKENAWIACVIFPYALIGFGWTTKFSVHFSVPLVFLFFFGLGSVHIFATSVTMLTEFIPHRAVSGIAVNNFVRNILACVGAMIAAPLYHTIGNGWLCTILGLLCLITGLGSIWSMKKYSAIWREQMTFSST